MSALMVKATLRTRCGCWQHMDVTFPPPREILLKLKPNQKLNPNEKQSLEIRHFDLIDFAGGKDGYADYEERAQ